MASSGPKARVPKLPLTDDERQRLRAARVKLAAMADCSLEDLAAIIAQPVERARFLRSLALFQRLANTGPETAKDLWVLGFREYADLAEGEPARMYQDLCAHAGVRLDPCVEDSLRLCVAQVRFPGLPEERLRWWLWSDQRGQPVRRPD